MSHQPKRSIGGSLALLALGGLGTYAGWRFGQRVRIEAKNRRLERGKRIVILGAGFGGREAALELARQLPNPTDGEILLVDQEPYLLFTPMLAEAAGGELDPDHIVSPATQLPDRIGFVQGRVRSVDLLTRRVAFSVGHENENIPERERVLFADHLVLALGAVANFHNIPGLEQHSITVKTLADAAVLRDRMLELLQRANAEPDPVVRRELLTIVVGGAGLTGVETMASVNALLRESARKFSNIVPSEIRTIIAEPGRRILPELSETLAGYARSELEYRGVEVRLNTRLTEAGADFVVLEKEPIPTRTVIWAGGVKPNPLVEKLACARGKHGGIVVNQQLAVPGFEGIWALGDSAEVPKPDGEGFYAPTAQNAVREGTLVGKNIAASLRGSSPEAFGFRPLGELALVGRHAGVAQILGIRITGVAAWAIWRLIYWAKMPSLSQRMRILSDWLLDLAFGRNLAPLPHLPAGQVKALAE